VRLREKAQYKLAQATRRHSDSAPAQPFTPLEKQIKDLKLKHPGILLLVEVGYKMRLFGDDAEIASQVCHIGCWQDRNYLTAGLPVHRLHVHVRKLVDAGHKVGIVRQAETAAVKASEGSRGPFERTLSAVYTAATMEAGDRADVGELAPVASGNGWTSAGLSAHLLVVVEAAKPPPGADVELGLVALEISTGDVLYSQFQDNAMRTEMEAQLLFTAPREVLQVGQELSDRTRKLLASFVGPGSGVRLEAVDRTHTPAHATAVLEQLFSGAGADAHTAANGSADPAELEAAGAMAEAVQALPPLVAVALAHALDYLRSFKSEAALRQCVSFRPFTDARSMRLSPNALEQLEILRNYDGGERGSLLWLLSHCRTPFGNRTLRDWVAHPLVVHSAIVERQQAIAELLSAPELDSADAQRTPLLGLEPALGGLPDLERGLMRILHCTSAPADFWTVLTAISGTAAALLRGKDGSLSSSTSTKAGRDAIERLTSPLLRRLFTAATASQVAETAATALDVLDKKAAQVNDKLGVFASRQRFPDVFERADAVRGAELALEQLLPGLRKLLRIPSLKYVHPANQGDGYLIEVPSARKDVPKDWQKVSSTKAVNRFYPPAVRAAVTQLLIARERHGLVCDAAWTAFQADVGRGYLPLRNAVRALGSLDALQSLTTVSASPGFTRPEVVDPEDGQEPRLVVLGGRHPMLDLLSSTPIVPNDVELRASGPRGLVITGPNMGGKSCYIRMAALIAIMAQVGAYVPADRVVMSVVDSVFTRMGASDNLAQGRSTFLEELSETADILNHAGPRSLVVMDELGRGTSTHDGVAIAAAVLRRLVLHNKCMLCFVTHYPQVAAVRDELPELLRCSYMQYEAISRSDAAQPGPGATEASAEPEMPQVTFLYKMIEGIASSSFGLNVARLAQLPESVVRRAAHKADEMGRLCEQPRDGGGQAAVNEEIMGVIQRLRPLLEGETADTDVTMLSSMQLVARCLAGD